MPQILDRVAIGLHGDFRPSSPSEFFALRLAERLAEPQAARHYSLLEAEHSVEKLLSAYHRTIAVAQVGQDLGRIFHAELLNNGGNGTQAAVGRLGAIRVERRCVGAAIFRGTRLESVRVRQLSSNPGKAEASVASFVNSLINDFHFESSAIETVSPPQQIQRGILTGILLNQLRNRSISVWELSKKTVMQAIAHPPINSRRELREIILQVWPQLNLKRDQVCVLDAAALGLFIQTERLFNNF